MSDDAFKPIGLDRSRLSTLMKRKKYGQGYYLSSPENVFYTTGYPCLPGSGNPIIYALRNQLPFFSFIGKRWESQPVVLGAGRHGHRVRSRRCPLVLHL